MEEQKPSERIIDRAVELWKRALAEPEYDNTGPGRRDLASGIASAMAGMLPRNNTPEVLEAFGKALKQRLMEADGRARRWLSVDYHPDPILEAAAEEAGLKMEFPWKSSMTISRDHVSFALGYGAERDYHYPLADGRWLVTNLCGSEISKIIDYVNGGNPEFRVEADEQPLSEAGPEAQVGQGGA